MKAMDRVNRIAGDLQGYLEDTRSKLGKRFIGVMHPVVPQEVIYAAGLHPFRLFPFGKEPISLAHSHLHIYTSSIFRAIWDQVLKNQYPFMDGVVLPESCETVTFFTPGWKWHRPGDFVETLSARPFKKTENSINFFAKEIERLASTMEDFTGKKTTRESIQKAISIFNKNRELLRQIYELRRQAAPPFSALEAFNICMTSYAMDKDENNKLLENVLDEVKQRKGFPKPKARLFLSGPCLIDARLFETIDSSGAALVADDTNTGSRSFWHSVKENGDPYACLAEAYSQIPCPFSASAKDRLDHLSKMIKDFKVDGVLFVVEKWCES
jgi:benzoyl-CoA reductase/2-hydroxyglutaryl-CoA dehydratase subunit BcrC/BadD/HgdB